MLTPGPAVLLGGTSLHIQSNKILGNKLINVYDAWLAKWSLKGAS